MKLELDIIQQWRLWCAVRRMIKTEREFLGYLKKYELQKSQIGDIVALRHLKKELS